MSETGVGMRPRRIKNALCMFLPLLFLAGCPGPESTQVKPSVPEPVKESAIPGFPTLRKDIIVGDNPFWVAVSPDGRYAYVSNSGSSTVTIIQTSDLTVVSTFGVKASPAGLSISPDGKILILTSRSAREVNLYSLSSGQPVLTATVPLDYEPEFAAFSPDGAYVLVTHPTFAMVSVIRVSDHRLLNTISVFGNPTCAAFLPDGTLAYVGTNHVRENLNVLKRDGASFSLLQTVQSGTLPQCLAPSLDGKTVYITDNHSQNLTLVDTASQNTKGGNITVQEGPAGIAVTPSGKYAYVANHLSNSVSVIDLGQGKTVGSVSVNGSPWGIAFSPDGSLAFVTESENILPAQRDLYQRQRSAGNQVTGVNEFRSQTLTVLNTNDYH